MATSYGSITIVDVTDFGQFSVVPMSNAGISIIYDPNALVANQYNPATMTLTPYVNYGGKDMSSESGITYSWYKRTDGATFDVKTTEEPYATTQNLTVNASEFTTVKSITYYIKATYTVDGTQLVAYGQITISKVTQATEIRDIELSGDNIFKYKYTAYDQSASIDGNSEITLTATYTNNLAVHAWYYYKKNSNNTWSWTNLSGVTNVRISGSTCVIPHDVPIFYDNKAQIKVTAHSTNATSTELTNVYDTYSILKLYDGKVGAPGENSVAIILSNEDQTIPCNGQGRPTASAFDLASTTIEVLEGGGNVTTDDVSTGYKVEARANGVTSDDGLVYDSTSQKYTYKVDGWDSKNSSETAYVTFTASRTGYQTLTKTMTFTKITVGKDGESPTVYNLSLSPNRVTTNSNGQVVGSTTITATVIAIKDTTTTDVTNTSGAIYYEWFKNGSSTAETTHSNTLTISSGTSVSSILCKIRKTNSSGDVVDSQSVAFIPAGGKGDKGATGDGAITLNFPQNMDTIGLKNDGTLASAYSLELPYTVYQGSAQTPAPSSGQPTGGIATNDAAKGYSFVINDLNFTGGSEGTITFGTNKVTITIPSGTKVYDSTNANHSLNGQCAIPIDYIATSTNASTGAISTRTDTILATFTWNLDVAPADGSSVTITDTWTRYRQTNSSTQPSDISKTGTKDKDTIEAAITAGGLTKPYYVWGRTHTTYTGNKSTDTYTVNFYPKDPKDGESVTTSSETKYACSTSGTSAPNSENLYKLTISEAVTASGLSKPYYIWTRTTTTYTYDSGGSAGDNTVTYSTSYYPQDKVELTLTANATVFQGPIETITITPLATVNGTSHTVTANEVHWKYVVNGAMSSEITTTDNTKSVYKSGANLVIKKEAVNGATSVECVLSTSGQNIYAYLPIEDNTDEFRCDLRSTIGDKITNGQGNGFVICDLYRNGQLIDNITATGGMPTVTQSRIPAGETNARPATVSAPTDLATNTLTSDIKSLAYQWKYQKINSNGGLSPITDSTYNEEGKAIYIDGSMINKKIVISCTVSVTYKTT